MTTRHVNSTEEALRDAARHRFVVLDAKGVLGSTLQGKVSSESWGDMREEKCLLFGIRFDTGAPDGSVPISIYGVPSQTVVRVRVFEASVRVSLIVVHDPAVEVLFREYAQAVNV